jgi:hypothetical protein
VSACPICGLNREDVRTLVRTWTEVRKRIEAALPPTVLTAEQEEEFRQCEMLRDQYEAAKKQTKEV